MHNDGETPEDAARPRSSHSERRDGPLSSASSQATLPWRHSVAGESFVMDTDSRGQGAHSTNRNSPARGSHGNSSERTVQPLSHASPAISSTAPVPQQQVPQQQVPHSPQAPFPQQQVPSPQQVASPLQQSRPHSPLPQQVHRQNPQLAQHPQKAQSQHPTAQPQPPAMQTQKQSLLFASPASFKQRFPLLNGVGTSIPCTPVASGRQTGLNIPQRSASQSFAQGSARPHGDSSCSADETPSTNMPRIPSEAKPLLVPPSEPRALSSHTSSQMRPLQSQLSFPPGPGTIPQISPPAFYRDPAIGPGILYPDAPPFGSGVAPHPLYAHQSSYDERLQGQAGAPHPLYAHQSSYDERLQGQAGAPHPLYAHQSSYDERLRGQAGAPHPLYAQQSAYDERLRGQAGAPHPLYAQQSSYDERLHAQAGAPHPLYAHQSAYDERLLGPGDAPHPVYAPSSPYDTSSLAPGVPHPHQSSVYDNRSLGQGAAPNPYQSLVYEDGTLVAAPMPPQHYAPPHADGAFTHPEHAPSYSTLPAHQYNPYPVDPSVHSYREPSPAHISSMMHSTPPMSPPSPMYSAAAPSSAGRMASPPGVSSKPKARWAYNKPQLLNLHVMYLSELPKDDTWMASVRYVVSIHAGSNLTKQVAPPRLLPTFNPKEVTTLPVVTKPANVFDGASAESLSREDQLQTQVFTHLADLGAKKCVVDEGEKCFFDEKFLVLLPKFEDFVVLNIWRLTTTYVTANKEYTLFGQAYLPLDDPKWHKKVCTWPLSDPQNTEKVPRVVGNGTFLFSLASTPEPCAKITAITVDKRTISLEWTEPPSDNGSPIKGYRIQYKKFAEVPKPKPSHKAYGDSSGKPQAGDEYEWQTVGDMLKDTQFTVEHLPGNTRFIFRVSARNLAGYGDPIESAVVVTGAVPPSAPGRVRLVGRSPDGVSQAFLEWDAPESDNGARIKSHRMWVKLHNNRAERWIDVGEISNGPTIVKSEDNNEEKVVYRAKITSLPASGLVMVTCAAINEAGMGPASEEDPSLAFEWQGEVWEVEERDDEPPMMQDPSVCLDDNAYEEPSATQVRMEQDQDYHISLLHDEVQAHIREQEALTLKVCQLRDEMDEQDSLAKMARQRMDNWGADNPNISKALEDATAKLDELNSEADKVAAELTATNALINDKRAMLSALES